MPQNLRALAKTWGRGRALKRRRPPPFLSPDQATGLCVCRAADVPARDYHEIHDWIHDWNLSGLRIHDWNSFFLHLKFV